MEKFPKIKRQITNKFQRKIFNDRNLKKPCHSESVEVDNGSHDLFNLKPYFFLFNLNRKIISNYINLITLLFLSDKVIRFRCFSVLLVTKVEKTKIRLFMG